MSTRIVLAKTAGQQPGSSHGCLRSSLYQLLETLLLGAITLKWDSV